MATKGCAVCGFICANGCCYCPHWEPTDGALVCYGVACEGHSEQRCVSAEGDWHFDLLGRGYNGSGEGWGFVAAYADDWDADMAGQELVKEGRAGEAWEFKIVECNGLKCSKNVVPPSFAWQKVL